jgi:hypothetical protein
LCCTPGWTGEIPLQLLLCPPFLDALSGWRHPSMTQQNPHHCLCCTLPSYGSVHDTNTLEEAA